MQSEDQLKGLDPTGAQDPRFDPNGDVARGVMASAIVRGNESPARKSRFRRPRVLVAAGGGSAATIAAIVALVGGGSAVVGPAAALADAAAQTAGFASGVVTVHTIADNAGHQISATQTLKFSGNDWDVTQQGAETGPNGEKSDSNNEIRQVNGKQYTLDSTAADPAWAESGDANVDAVGSKIAGGGLVDLVKAADNVTQNGSTFHAMLDGEALKSVATSPFGIDDALESGPVSVTITLADNGTMQKMELDTDGVARTTEFSELGAPQTIDVPQP